MKTIGKRDYMSVIGLIISILIVVVCFGSMAFGEYKSMVGWLIPLWLGLGCVAFTAYPIILLPSGVILYNDESDEVVVYLSRKKGVTIKLSACENISIVPGAIKGVTNISFKSGEEEIIARYISNSRDVLEALLRLKKESNTTSE